MPGGKHGDDDGDKVINRLDPDAAAYEGGFVDELGGTHPRWSPEFAYEFPDPGWRPESDFTGEWVEEHVARMPRGVPARTGVTAATLRAAMGADLPLGRYPTLVADFNAALLAAGCTTVNRAAMFAAQVGHESLGLRYFEELWGPTAQQRKYEPGTTLARDLGNTQPGDGSRFRGRGPIQLTGRGGYTTFLAWCRAQGFRPPDFLADPAQVATSRWGFLAASHYWTVRRPRINGLCDSGDLEGVTRQINGGTTGIDDRRRRWQACLRLGAALLPAAAAAPAPAPPPPGGIETMAFEDQFTDWAGNKQTVRSWMDHVDERLFQLGRALVDPSIPSPVDGRRRAAGSYLADIGDIERRMGELDQKLDRILAALPK